MNRVFAVAFAVLALLSVSTAPIAAQDASPAASPAPGPCVAPALPPGTPTPMEESPAGGAAGETEGATPESEAEGEAAFPTPTPLPAGTIADPATAERVLAGLTNWFNCFGTGEYEAVAALSTPNLIAWITGGSTNPYDWVAFMPEIAADSADQQELFLGNVLIYADGRFSVDHVYRSGHLVENERFYLVEEEGFFKVDALAFGLPVDPALLGAEPTVVEVALVDYAFAPDTYAIPAGGAVVFRATNRGTEPHVLSVMRYPAGTTAEQVIEGEVDALEDATEFLGGHFAVPGQGFDVALVDLEPGVYFLICDVGTADGTPHYHLGMVARITVG
jgi:hypothetical protein